MSAYTKFTRELSDQFVAALGRGNFIETCCSSVGITPATYYSWIKRGKEGEEPFLTFYLSCQRAQGQDQQAINELLLAAGGKDWKAAAYRAGARYPELFGEKRQVDTMVRARLTEIMERLESLMSPHSYQEMLSGIAEINQLRGSGLASGEDQGQAITQECEVKLLPAEPNGTPE